jgi:hypothetical protein
MATDILFVKNPVSTAMGILFGLLSHGLISLLSPFFPSFEVIRTSSVNLVHYLAFGVFAFNLSNFLNRHKISPEIESAFKAIDKQVSEGKLSKIEAKQSYRLLIASVIDNAKAKKSTDTLPS